MKKVFSVAICDDEVSVLDVIAGATRNAFSGQGVRAEIESFSSVSALEKAMESKTYDLLLLDIELPKEDGIHFGKRLGKMSHAPDIVFVSSREDRMYDAFAVHPFGFVRKSHFLKDIVEVVQAYIADRGQENAKFLLLQVRGQTMSLPISGIRYIEGSRKNQLVYLDGQEEPLQVTLSMKKLEEDLASRGFLRVHSGYLVNYRYIRSLGTSEITLTDGNIVPVSRRKFQEIKLQYMEFAAREDSYIF